MIIFIILVALVFSLPFIITLKKEGKFSLPLFLIMIIPVGFVIFVSVFSSLFVDYQWFKSLGFAITFRRRLIFRILTFIISFLVTLLFTYLAMRFKFIKTPFESSQTKKQRKIFKISFYIGIVAVSFFFSLTNPLDYNKLLLFLYRTPVGVKTPIFNKDLSFYLFTLPFALNVLDFLISLSVFVIFLYLFYSIIMSKARFALSIRLTKDEMYRRFAYLFGVLFLIISVKTYFSIFNLMISKRGAVYGIGYTDLHVRIPIYYVLISLLLILSILLFIYSSNLGKFRPQRKLLISIVVLFVLILVLYGVLPGVYQRVIVEPNELAKEKEFLSYNIEFTRKAYGLDRFNNVFISSLSPLTEEIIKNNAEVIDSARLWDWRALIDTYKEIQGIRPYYRFIDVDVDRYNINGNLREVMLSARELDQSLLPEGSKSWVNLHLKYTHGYGVCMNPVNEFTEEGLPVLWIKDIPPRVGVEGVSIKRPEIYYGELTDNYVFVKTSTDEFDYPRGNENVYTRYEGEGGIEVGGLLKRIMLASKFNDMNILLSRYLDKDSRIMMYRNIIQRVDKIAPFLLFGYDPYIFIDKDGNLMWMGDGFTISSFYPYSEHVKLGDIRFNYIRNSVKFTVDAYNGKVKFYVIDDKDPIINTYMKIYPDLFVPQEKMSEDLKAHMRFPDDLVEVQSFMYRDYHMTDVQVFYNREDRWEKAKEKYKTGIQEMQPYFVIMKIEGKEEFVNILPMTPLGKSNLIALFVGRCDEPNYGETVIYRFSKETVIYGPLQIEARIDQNTDISKTLTLWNQQGSQVIRGNTILLLIDNALLYVEPLYLQATEGKIPQLKKVITASTEKVSWGDSLYEALDSLVSFKPREEKEKNIQELINSLIEYMNDYKELTREGKFSEAGKMLEKIQEIINILSKMKP